MSPEFNGLLNADIFGPHVRVIHLRNFHIHLVGDNGFGEAAAHELAFELQPHGFVRSRIEPAKDSVIGPKHRISARLDGEGRPMEWRSNQTRQLGAIIIFDLHTKTSAVLEEIRYCQGSWRLILNHDPAHKRQRSVPGIPSDAIRLDRKMDGCIWRGIPAETSRGPEHTIQ